jgi:membrane protein implicated in regulation of membrane protease activity
MAASTIWWILAGLVVVAELLTGSIYLLMVAVGLGAAAIAAHLGAGLTMQIFTAAVVGSAALAVWHFGRGKAALAASSQVAGNKNVNLDIGEQVTIESWDTDGNARVQYRGSSWQASLKPGAHAAGRSYRIADVEGSRLIVEPV